MILAEDLRQAVLQAALQGKLTEQLETDSDVDEMLEIIRKKKNQLIRNGDIKKSKLIKFVFNNDILFEIPDYWKWTTLDDITTILGDGLHGTPQFDSDGDYYFINGNNLANRRIVLKSDTKKVSKEEFDKYKKELNNNTMMISINGTLGNIAFYNGENVVLGKSTCYFNVFESINKDYLFYFFLSFFFQKYIRENATGTTIRNVSLDVMRSTHIPLPSIEEQQRIVDKINEIMPKIDEYEKIEKELEAIKKEFPTDMKNALLQAAMQGKLTEQLESDSSVDELLQEIGEKELKDSNWKAKKELEIDEILDIIDSPFIPNSWKWVKLSDIAFSNIGLTYKPSDKTEDGVIVLRSSNIQNGKMDYNDIVKVNMEIPENKMCDIGDILMCVRNGSKSLVGKVAVIDKSNMSFGAFMSIIISRCNQFLYYFFNSNMFKRQMHINSSTETINQITQDMLFNCIIPLPPIEEQQRIVERLDTLLLLCEDLRE